MTGCQSFVAMSHDELKREYVKKSEAEQNLRNLQEEYSKKLSDKEVQISTAKDNVINGQEKQMQAAADAFYSINQAATLYPQIGALEFTKDRTKEGFTALGKAPTVKEIIEGGERLKKYLTSYSSNDTEAIRKLKEENQKLLGEMGVLVKVSEEAKIQVKTLQSEKENLKVEKETAVATAQAKLNQVNDAAIKKSADVIAAEKAARESAEKLEKTKREIMIWCGIGAALAMAGAVYSPVGKGGLAIISGVLAFVALAIMYIQPWMVLTVGLVGAAGAIGYVLYKHNLAETTNENMINAIQDVKEKSSPAYEDLKKSLQEWNTAYKTTKSGEITEVADKKVMDYIDKKLAEYGRLTKKK